MGVHEDYGKRLLRQLLGNGFTDWGQDVEVAYQGGITARIDGVVKDCAIEIESRTDKQIRGSLVDLLFHPLPKKLLIIIPANMPNPEATVRHCKAILQSLKRREDVVRVVLLAGTGIQGEEERDAREIERALRELGVA